MDISSSLIPSASKSPLIQPPRSIFSCSESSLGSLETHPLRMYFNMNESVLLIPKSLFDKLKC